MCIYHLAIFNPRNSKSVRTIYSLYSLPKKLMLHLKNLTNLQIQTQI